MDTLGFYRSAQYTLTGTLSEIPLTLCVSLASNLDIVDSGNVRYVQQRPILLEYVVVIIVQLSEERNSPLLDTLNCSTSISSTPNSQIYVYQSNQPHN